MNHHVSFFFFEFFVEETKVDQEINEDFHDFWSLLRSCLEDNYSASEVNDIHNQIYSVCSWLFYVTVETEVDDTKLQS